MADKVEIIDITRSIAIGKGGSWMSGIDNLTPKTSVNDDPDNTEKVKTKDKKNIEISNWGTNNKLPFEILEDLKKVTVAGAGLRKRARIHLGRGVVAFKYETDEAGKQTVLPVDDENVKAFFRKNKINKFQKAQTTDYEIFNIAFPEFILDGDGGIIQKVFHKTAPYIRLSVKEDVNGVWRSKWAVYSPKWNDSVSEEDTVAVPLIPQDMDVEEVKEYCQKNKISKFIRPIYNYMPSYDYYPIPFWNSARESEWMDIAKLIPSVKKAIINNAMTLKYIVRIPMDYFDKKYPNKNPKERKAAAEEDLKGLDDFLKDTKNTGKSLITYYDIDRTTKQKIGAWEVEVIDNKIQDGVLNLDSAAANSEILFAIGIDPTLIGSGMPGKELGAKSGSDKREAYNIAISDAMADRFETLDTLEFIRDYNGWDEEIHFAYENNILTTLDKNPTGVEKRNV